MDPLSITAGVIAVVQVTATCLKLCSRPSGSSEYETATLKQISTDLFAFNGIVRNLQTYIEIAEGDESRLGHISHIQEPLARSEESLRIIEDALVKRNDSRIPRLVSTHVTGRRFDRRLSQALAILKSSGGVLQLAIQADELALVSAVERYVSVVAEDVRDLRSYFEENRTLQRERESRDQMQFDEIQEWHRTSHDALRGLTSRQMDSIHSEMLRWLGAAPEDTHNDLSSLRHEGTGDWLLRSEQFDRWRSNPVSAFLWLEGIPGSGKSVLTSTVINTLGELDLRNADVAIAYHYCDFSRDQSLTAAKLLGIYLSQLLTKGVMIDGHESQLDRLYHQHKSKSSFPALAELEYLFLRCAKRISTTYLILDGLDEVPNRAGIIELLTRLRLSDGNIKILVASRNEPDISAAFRSPSTITIESDIISRDIETYMHARVARSRLKNSEEAKDVVSTLAHRAGGMFLWARCHIEELCRALTPMDIKVAESLPRSLGAMYERILTNMDDCSKCMAHRILQFVMFARRPLSVPELADAIAINETTKTMHDLHRARLLHPEDILVICGSLIRRSEVTGHVLLAHHSIREFLTSHDAQQMVPEFFSPVPSTCFELSKACFIYLTMREFNTRNFPYSAHNENEEATEHRHGDDLRSPWESETVDVPDSAFLDYAASNCWYHTRQICSQHLDTLWPTLEPFLDSSQNYFYFWTCVLRYLQGTYKYPDGFGPLHACALQGAKDVANKLLSVGYPVDEQITDRKTSLHIAVENDHDDMVYLLLSAGANANILCEGKRSPLHAALETGNDRIITHLVVHNADVDASLPSGDFPLSIVVENQLFSMFPVLWKHSKRKGSQRLPDGRGLQHLAAIVGSTAIMELVYPSDPLGFNQAARDNDWWTPLHFAAHYDHRETVKFLLDKTEELMGDRNGWTPLHAAVDRRNLDCIVLLRHHAKGQNIPRSLVSSNLAFPCRGGGYLTTGGAGDGRRLPEQGERVEPGQRVDDGASSRDPSLLGSGDPINRYLMSRSANEKYRLPEHEVHEQSGRRVEDSDPSGYDPSTDVSLDNISVRRRPYTLSDLPRAPLARPKKPRVPPPLVLAVRNRYLDGVRCLLQSDSNADEIEEALEAATWDSSSEILSLIVRYSAKDSIERAVTLASDRGHLQTQVQLMMTLYHRGIDGHPLVGAAKGAYDNHNDLANYIIHDNHPHVGILNEAYGESVLHKRYQIAALLVGHGASPTAQNGQGQNVLHRAVQNCQYDVVEYLIEQGMNVKVSDACGRTPLHLLFPLRRNDERWHYPISFYRVFARDGDPGVPAGNYIPLAKLLIDHGADISSVDGTGQNVLHLAIRNGLELGAKFFLSSGCDPDVPDAEGKTPLLIAVQGGRHRTVQLALQKLADVLADCDAQRANRVEKCLHSCIEDILSRADVKMFPLFLPLKDRWLSSECFNAQRTVNIASHCMRANDRQLLISLFQWGLQVDSTADDGMTVLHHATVLGNEEMIRAVLEYAPTSSEDRYIEKASIHESDSHEPEIENPRLEACRVGINAVDKDGMTALHHAATKGYEGIAKLLLDSGVELEATSAIQETALNCAAWLGHSAVVRVLLDAGADPNSQAGWRVTPLHQAAANGHNEIVDMLTEAGGNFMARGENGRTALHLAAGNGHCSTVERLLQMGSIVDPKADYDERPLDAATSRGHPDIADLLRAWGSDTNAGNENS